MAFWVMDFDFQKENGQTSEEEHEEVGNQEGIMGLRVESSNFVHIHGVLSWC